MHKNKEKDKNAYFKIPNPPYPTHGGQPTNSQTCSKSFPKFIVLHATDNSKLSNASPFLISKAVQGSAGSVKSIKKLPSGDLLIETATQAQSINLLRCTNLSNILITATPHKTLNSSKEVIYCPDLIPLPDSEIEEELASQGVEAVKRITSIKDDVFAVKVTVMEQLLVAALLPAINAVVRSAPAKHVRQNGESVQTARENTLLIPKSVQNGNKKKKYKELNSKPITNNLIEQETILSPPETSSTDLESLNLDKWSPETLHLSVPSDTEVLMEIDESSTKRPATDIVQEAAKILKPSIRIESGGIQTTKEVEDVKLLSKKGKSRRSFSRIKYKSEKPKGSP
ncbi:CCHC-type domain-containing protein [Trichonephila clavipes]|nr:CCHC-type domain-containing protein [Trichonephila clavipes]